MNIFSYISLLFVEKKCYSCKNTGHFFCPQCCSGLELYQAYCYLCKKPSSDFKSHPECQKYLPLSQVIVLTRYRHTWVKRLLRHAKFYNAFSAYDDLIIPHKDFLQQYVSPQNSILIPVPMHFLRKWKRWYNQSEKIAGILSHVLHIPVKDNYIKRRKYTKQQSHLSQSNRAKNLSWVFSLSREKIDKNTTIYLVDDVISTGSTLSEIAKLLHKNGHKDVRAIVLASD